MDNGLSVSPSSDIFLGYVVCKRRTGEFLTMSSRHPAKHVPPYCCFPAWAHRYLDLKEAEEDAGRDFDEVLSLYDSEGEYVTKPTGDRRS